MLEKLLWFVVDLNQIASYRSVIPESSTNSPLQGEKAGIHLDRAERIGFGWISLTEKNFKLIYI
ncbi:hypothetical protein HS1genome_0594 [Sulfodiicoccus acidiphilus]|uniref:Uncharacterized protein n=1 Tax=Sulfodiicoccus acidiphilus TaxID=1670455 RepID=A0A348B203_9CREN|nr:hypothetical protein HS1genome_0594 [Sulfodiicoccus acidiphilus]GGU03054.1 hypothetical protein GCM10007116_20090 [Sulfodiicoccus acidiphilus]